MADETIEQKIWDVAKALPGMAADAVAAKEPLIGVPLQVVTNSPDYQVRKNRILDYVKDEPIREANRLKAKEYISPQAQEARRAVQQNSYSTNIFLRDKADMAHKEMAMARYDKEFWENHLSRPEFAALNDNEKKSFMQTSAYKDMQSCRYAIEQVFESYNPNLSDEQRNLATDRINRALARQGYEIVEVGGKQYLNMSGDNGMGMSLEINKNNINTIKERLYQGAMKELAYRLNINHENTKNSPAGRFIASYANQMRLYNNNSCRKAVERTQAIVNQYSPTAQKWSTVNQALQDYENSDLVPANKISNLLQLVTPQVDQQGNVVGQSILGSLGFNLTVDPTQLQDPRQAQFVKTGESRIYTFDEIKKIASEKDVIRKALDEDVAEQRKNFEISLIQRAGRSMAQTAKAVAGTESKTNDKNAINREDLDTRLFDFFGNDYYYLDSDVKEKMQNALNDYDKSKEDMFKKRKTNDLSKLPNSDLNQLDLKWKKVLDSLKLSDTKFPSGVHGLIKHNDKNKLIEEIKKAEEKHNKNLRFLKEHRKRYPEEFGNTKGTIMPVINPITNEVETQVIRSQEKNSVEKRADNSAAKISALKSKLAALGN